MKSTAPTNERTIGQWRIQSQLGSGSFAVVHLARHSVTDQAAAVKEINLDKLNTKLRQSLDSEISILKRISHPNIVKLYEVIPQGSHLFLIMEYCSGGDLAAFIKSSNAQNNNKGIGEAAAQTLMHQLAAGLQEMWCHHLVHRDLKPQNLLLSYNQKNNNTTDGGGNDNATGTGTDTGTDYHSPSSPTSISTNITLKIADFGFARALQPQGLAETLCGSPLYMSPEIMHYHKYDAKADLWSVGAVLYELVVGRPPFTGNNTFQLLRNIERSHPGSLIPADVAGELSVECKGLIQALLRRNPVERISFEEFFRHPFIRLTNNNSGDGDGNGDVMATQLLSLHISESQPPLPTTNQELAKSRVLLKKARSTSHIPTSQVTTIVGFRNTTTTTTNDGDDGDVAKAAMKLQSPPSTTTMMTSRFSSDVNLASHNHHHHHQNHTPPPMSELSAQLRQPTPQIPHTRNNTVDRHHTSSTMEKAVMATAINIIHNTNTTMAAKTPSPLPTAAPIAMLPSGSVVQEEEEESGYILIHSPSGGRKFTSSSASSPYQQKTDQKKVVRTSQAAVVVEGLFALDDDDENNNDENNAYSKKGRGDSSKKKVEACDDVIAQWKDAPAQHLVIVARSLELLARQYNKYSSSMSSSSSAQLSAERSYEKKKAQFALQLAALQVLKYNDGNKKVIGNDSRCRVTSDESAAVSILEAARITATELSEYTSSPSSTHTITTPSSSSSHVLPNPWVLLYNAALEWAHEAALDELLCQYHHSHETYLLSLAILYFFTTDCVSSAIWNNNNMDGQVVVGVDQDVLKKHVGLVSERRIRVYCQLSNIRHV